MVCGSNVSTALVWNWAHSDKTEYHVEENDPLSAVAELQQYPDSVAKRMANPGRDAAADVIHGQCLPAAGKFARLRGRERSVSSRLGSLYSSRFLMINGINDELILAARLLLATLFLIFGWRKLRDFSGTVSQMVQLGVPTPVLAAVVAIFMELPVAFAVAVGAFTRPFGRTHGFIRAGNCAYRASLLDSERCGLRRQLGRLLQRPQHYGRLLAVVHYRCRKIFDRCIAKHRRAMTCGYWAEDATFMSRYVRYRTCDRRFHRQPSRRSITSSSMVKRLA